MSHTTYAWLFMAVLYTMGFIGMVVAITMVLRAISPYTHGYITNKRDMYRGMDTTRAHYAHTTNRKEES